MPFSTRVAVIALLTILSQLLAEGRFPSRVSAQSPGDDWSIETTPAPSTTPLRFTATEGTWISVDVSPDGRRIAFDLLGHIYEMGVEGGLAIPLTEGRSWNEYPRYSPDGRMLAFTSDRSGTDDVWILHLETDSLENLSRMEAPVVQATWSADGRAVYGTSVDPSESTGTTAHRFNRFGGRQKLFSTPTGSVVPNPFGGRIVHFEEDPGRNLLFYEHLETSPPHFGASIEIYDLETGETRGYRSRRGGAFNPALSPDRKYLAYGHRDDQETVLVLHDLDTRDERVLVRGLDRDRQESRNYPRGVQANIAWHPGGRELFFSRDGGIRAVDVQSGAVREIPFEAPVDRRIDATLRFRVDLPAGRERTLAHRWAHRTLRGILFEALGDLWLADGDRPRNLTTTSALESSPVYDPATATLTYVSWTDTELGAVVRRPLAGGAATTLSSRPGHYGSLALSPDGRMTAYLRSVDDLRGFSALENDDEFELVVVGPDGGERVLTGVSGTSEDFHRLPLTIIFAPDGERLLYTEFVSNTLTLRRIGLDGLRKETLYRFPHAVRAVVSPDLHWIAFREYQRSWVTSLDFAGQIVTVSGFAGIGFAVRVDGMDGPYMAWSPGSDTLSWSRGGFLYEKPLEQILRESEDDGAAAAGPPLPTTTASAIPIAVDYTVAAPAGTVALTGARILTMDRDRSVLENATVLIHGDRIREVGADVAVPDGARVFDLEGHTIMPGIVDAHAHYGSYISQSNQVEQQPPSLAAALAHGVTTMVELYGSSQKDPWVMDMLRSGRMVGPRLESVGAPLYGLPERRPKTYRPIRSYADALEAALYNRDQGARYLKDYGNLERDVRHRYAVAARELGMNLVAESAARPAMNWTQIVDGFTGIEHAMGITPLYEDVLRLFGASETGVTPTLLVVYNGPNGQAYFDQSHRVWEDPKLLRFTEKDHLIRFRRVTHYWPDDLYAHEVAAEMKKLFDQGTLVNLGGHGQMLGLDVHWEMDLFAQGGFVPMDVLQVATINGARYHGLDHEIGSIEPGKRADLVILTRNPLENIANTQAIRYVMRSGVLYNGDDAARVWPDPAPPPKLYFRR